MSIFEGAQAGAALLLALNALVMGFASVMLTHLGEESRLWFHEQHNVQVLALAREALLAYRGVTGALPCPDRSFTGEGRSDGECGGVAVGHFPWQEVGVPPLRDRAGGWLWYAMTHTGHLRLRGEVNSREVVALVIAPGAALAGQRRAGAIRRNDWLEEANRQDPQDALDDEFQAGPASLTFNDRIVTLRSRDE